ncbi:MAG: UbiH/UbiF/VisC/COQ6 family ubiquinone biosynthesis hydroxylase [Rhodobacteraceae bacterium]|nr:UbiH/UbiF/VisC/COQ6 family ubiquinone biosynthesis hydroxylase [Paracoccaceae bacterium]
MERDILITGGGLIGSTLALGLAQAGFKVTMLDALPKGTRRKKGFDGRSYAMALATTKMLRTLGLWETLAPNAQPMNAIKVSDGRAGQAPSPFFMHFDHAEIGTEPMGYMIEDRHARIALLEAEAAEPNFEHIPEARVVSQMVEPGRATVTLEDGRELSAPLLIGCDGRASGTAERAGIKRMGWAYGQTALVCALHVEKPHEGVAHQLFLPEGPLAILPLTENRVGVVWTESEANAAGITGLDDEGYLEVLRPRFGDFLGDISLAGERFTYPLGLSLAQSFAADRVALVGDAAHGIHPIAGQGLNAGMRDVAALVEVLSEARQRGEDIGVALVLGRYQQWRRFDTATLALATDTFNRLFSNDIAPVRTLRDLGMGVVNALPGLRRTFIREAAGLTGDLPRLLQGRPLP